MMPFSEKGGEKKKVENSKVNKSIPPKKRTNIVQTEASEMLRVDISCDVSPPPLLGEGSPLQIASMNLSPKPLTTCSNKKW